MCVWGGGGGGGLHKNVSQTLATVNSSRGEIARKTLSVMKSFTGNMRHVNFCTTFIMSISLFLELASSNLVQTLLNPSKVI